MIFLKSETNMPSFASGVVSTGIDLIKAVVLLEPDYFADKQSKILSRVL